MKLCLKKKKKEEVRELLSEKKGWKSTFIFYMAVKKFQYHYWFNLQIISMQDSKQSTCKQNVLQAKDLENNGTSYSKSSEVSLEFVV